MLTTARDRDIAALRRAVVDDPANAPALRLRVGLALIMFMDDYTTAQIAPSGIFGQTFAINCNNPLLSASELSAICGANVGSATATTTVGISKRNVEGGGRQNNLRHTDFRYVLGLKGAIDSGFSYDVYGQFSRTIYAENYQNDFSLSRTAQALNVITVGGVNVCADPNARAAGCAPYNIFQAGGVTPAALTYLQTPGFQEGTVDEYVADASISGKLEKYGIKSPFANDGVGIAIGTEYRKEKLNLLTDAEFSSGDLAGQGGPTKPVSGQFSVYEFFGELSVPLIEDKPFFRSLVASGGYRYSHYSSAGSTNTYKGQVEWQPIQPIRFRASYNRAVRAPNIQELFAPQGQSLFAGTDPCALKNPGATALPTSATVNGNTFAQCARTGVTAADFGLISSNPANQYNQFTGGNPNLTPEVSDTYSAGAVLQPGGPLKGPVISADYFNIKVNNTVGTVGAQLILNQCLLTGNPTFCNLITRDPNPGPTLGYIYGGPNGYIANTNLNVGKLQTKGVDVAGSYRLDLDRFGLGRFGSVGFDFVGTFLDKLSYAPGVPASNGDTSYDCRHLYGVTCGVPEPVFRSKLRVTFNFPGNVQFSGNWRHISGVYSEGTSSNGYLKPEGFSASDRRLPAYNYFDLTTAIRVADKFSLRVGANNILDKDPPIIGSGSLSGTFGNGNTYPQVYDAQGRYVFAGVTVDF